MKVHSLTFALLALLVSAALGQNARKVQPDAEKLQGQWKFVSFEVDGIKVNPEGGVLQRVKEKGEVAAPKSKFTVRCLNKDATLRPDELGQLDLEVEISVVADQEVPLKPGEFRLAILDANSRQLDELAIAIPKEWQNKTFKKGANIDTLTLTFPVLGDVVDGRAYYLAVVISPGGADGVYPTFLRLVKFNVDKTAK